MRQAGEVHKGKMPVLPGRTQHRRPENGDLRKHMPLDEEAEDLLEGILGELQIAWILVEEAGVHALDLVMQVPGRVTDPHVGMGVEVVDGVHEAVDDETVVVGVIHAVHAPRVPERAVNVAHAAAVLALAKVADRQSLGREVLHDSAGVVLRGIVGHHDLVGKGDLVMVREICQRLLEMPRAVVGRDADAQLDVTHPASLGGSSGAAKPAARQSAPVLPRHPRLSLSPRRASRWRLAA